MADEHCSKEAPRTRLLARGWPSVRTKGGHFTCAVRLPALRQVLPHNAACASIPVPLLQQGGGGVLVYIRHADTPISAGLGCKQPWVNTIGMILNEPQDLMNSISSSSWTRPGPIRTSRFLCQSMPLLTLVTGRKEPQLCQNPVARSSSPSTRWRFTRLCTSSILSSSCCTAQNRRTQPRFFQSAALCPEGGTPAGTRRTTPAKDQ